MNNDVIISAIEKLPTCSRCREKRLICDKGIDTCRYCQKAGVECYVQDGEEIVAKSELRTLISALRNLANMRYDIPEPSIKDDYNAYLFHRMNDDGTLHFTGPTDSFSVAAQAAATNVKVDSSSFLQDKLNGRYRPNLDYLGIGDMLTRVLSQPAKHKQSDNDILRPGVVFPLVNFFLEYALACGDLQPVVHKKLKSLLDGTSPIGPVTTVPVSVRENPCWTFQIAIMCALTLETLSKDNPQVRMLSAKYFEVAQKTLSSSMEVFSEDTALNTYLISLYYLQNPILDTSAWYSTIWTCIVLGELEYQGPPSDFRRELFWVNYVLEFEMSISKCMPSAWSGRAPTLDYSPIPAALEPVVDIMSLEEEIISKLYLEIRIPMNLLEVVETFLDRIKAWEQSLMSTQNTTVLRLHYYQAQFLCLKPLLDRKFLEIAEELRLLYETCLFNIIDIYCNTFHTKFEPSPGSASGSTAYPSPPPKGDLLRPFNQLYVNGLYRACVCLTQISVSSSERNLKMSLLMRSLSILSECIVRWPYVEELRNNVFRFIEASRDKEDKL